MTRTDTKAVGVSLHRDFYEELEDHRPELVNRSIYYEYWLRLGFELDRALNSTWDRNPFDPTNVHDRETRIVLQQLVRDGWEAESGRLFDEMASRMAEE